MIVVRISFFPHKYLHLKFSFTIVASKQEEKICVKLASAKRQKKTEQQRE